MESLITWVLGAALSICIVVIAWVANNLVGLKVTNAQINAKLDQLIKENEIRHIEFESVKLKLADITERVIKIEQKI